MANSPFASPAFESMGLTDAPQPFAPYAPTSGVGLGNLGPSLTDMAALGERLVKVNEFRLPDIKQPPSIAFSPSKNQLFVNGMRFSADDATSALEAESLASGPGTGLPTDTADWVPLSQQAYGQFLQSIKDPSTGRLFKKNFGRGVDSLQMIAGGAIQGIGDLTGIQGLETAGKDIVLQQIADLNKTAPFQREFSEIDSGSKAWDWAVASLGQAGPSLLESVAVALGGAAIGTATGGPAGTVGGAVLSVGAKEAVKQQIKAAALKKAQVGWAGLEVAEKALLKRAAAATYAAGASLASNYAAGFGESYLATEEAGVANPYAALLAAAPYAALESLPEFLLFTRYMGNKLPAVTAGTTKLKAAGQRGALGLREGALGTVAEGLTEAGQELVTGALAPIVAGGEAAPDLASRVLEAGAAGAITGTAVGGASGLLRGRAKEAIPTNKPTNLLEQKAGPTSTALTVVSPAANMQGGSVQTGGVGQANDLIGGIGSDSVVRPRTASERPFFGQVTPGDFGPQGVLDLGPSTVGEVRQRSMNVGEQAPRMVWNETTGQYEQQAITPPPSDRLALPAPTFVNPNQGVLQFGSEAPTGIGFTNQQTSVNPIMEQQMNLAQSRQAQAQAQQQAATQRQADLDRLGNIAAAQRQLDLAAQAPTETPAPTPAPQPMPMVQAQQRAPRQISMFDRGQPLAGTPRPSRGEGLRRGIGVPVAPALTADQIAIPGLPAQTQIPLFTQRGQPSVAALKSVAKPQKVVPTVEQGAAIAKPTGKAVTPATAAKARKAETLKSRTGTVEYEDGAIYTGQLKNNEPNGTGAMTYPDGSTYTGQWKNGTTNGQGRFEDIDGTVMEGKFTNGEFEGEVQKPAKQKKGKQDAVQKQGAASVPLRKGTKTGEEVGKEVRRTKEPAGKGQALKKQDEVTAPKKGAALKKGRAAAAAAPATDTDEARKLLEAQIAEAVRKLAEEKAAAVAVVTTPLPTRRMPPKDQTSRELMEDLMRSVEETKSESEKVISLLGVMEYAYTPDSNDRKAKLDVEAKAFLDSVEKDAVFKKALVRFLRTQSATEGETSATDKAGNQTPLFQMIIATDLLEKAKQIMNLQNVPAEYQNEAIGNTPVTPDKDTIKDNSAIKLLDYIRDINTRTGFGQTVDAQAKMLIKLTEMWAQVRKDGLQAFVAYANKPISAYFNPDGTPRTVQVNKKLRVVSSEISEDTLRDMEAMDSDRDLDTDVDPDLVAAEQEEVQAKSKGKKKKEAPGEYTPPFSLDDWNVDGRKPSGFDSGRYKRDDGSPITSPLPLLKVRQTISNFLSRLARKPSVFTYANQADLKARNPELYARAVAARPQGDFDTVSAAGYSFGDGNVIIFSDRIATDQHLKFVLAHETMGHFGLRGIIPANKFDALMERLYQEHPYMQSAVDAAMDAEGMSRAEAVEEYLADYAASLDTSIVAKVWNAIKGFINRIGYRFGDETVRYFVSQARAYNRTGNPGIAFDVSDVIKRLYVVEYGKITSGTGRFATAGDYYADNRMAGLMIDTIGGVPKTFNESWEYLKAQGVDSLASYDKFKATFLSLLNYRARLNPGMNELERIIDQGRDISMSIKVKNNEKLRKVLGRSIDLGLVEFSGTTTEQTKRINEALYAGQRWAVSRIDRLSELGSAPLYTFDDNGNLLANQLEINRLAKQGQITFEMMRDGFDYTVLVPEGDKMVEKTERFAGYKDITEQSIEWTGYLSLRESVNDVELQLLRARYLGAFAERGNAYRELGELMTDGKQMSKDSQTFLDRMITKYRDIYTDKITLDERGYPKFDTESMTLGNEFLVALNKAIAASAVDPAQKQADIDGFKAFFKGKEADDAAKSLEAMRKEVSITPENKFVIQNRVKQIVLSDISAKDADLFTKRSLATGYTPILREGQYQVRVQVTDPKTGRLLRPRDSYREQFVFSQMETPSEARAMADSVNDLFEDKDYEIEVYDENTQSFVVKKVRLEAIHEAALDAIAAPPELNYNDFIRGLRQFDVALNPKKMEQITVALTRQNSSARNRLQRAFTPGDKRDGIMAISRHIESRASTVAKMMMRPRVSELMNLSLGRTQRLWNGDKALLESLRVIADRVEADPKASPEAKTLARREYQQYKYMYETTNPVNGLRRGNEFYNEAAKTMAFLDGNRNVDESDFGSGKLVSQIRASTSLIQLGASIATGALNFLSIYTNGLPYLSSYNERTAFGGGFGFGQSVAQLHIALKQVGVIGMNPASETSRDANRAEFYDEIAENPQLQQKYGLKEHEARFIANEIREGSMIPAQSNAMIGMARGLATSGLKQKFIDGWMAPFNLTEQASRRSLGLAAYRMQYDRVKAAGLSDTEAQTQASEFAVKTLQLTLGEYSVLNRPPAWRSGIQSFMYMYKVFPTTSVQMLANLSREGKIGMLAALWVLTGLQGLPFAEDLEDLIDTIAQKLGFKKGSIRYEIAKFADGIVPGSSSYLLGGVINRWIPADVAGRVSLGNMLPGTGVLLAGADVARELGEIAGPAPSAILGTANMFADAIRAPFSARISALDVVRESPITAFRALGDAIAYSQSGAIVDKRGYVVSPDIGIGTIATRLLGFYPSSAAESYQGIKIANRITDYQKDVTAGFRQAYIKARISNDTAAANGVLAAVRDWNEGARGTALEIRNFEGNSQKALREARLPAKERTLRASSRAARDDLDYAFELLSDSD